MQLIRVDRTPTQGSSIRGTIKLIAEAHSVDFSVDVLVKIEIPRYFYQPDMYQAFARKIKHEKEKLPDLLTNRKARKNTVAGIIAPNSVTPFL